MSMHDAFQDHLTFVKLTNTKMSLKCTMTCTPLCVEVAQESVIHSTLGHTGYSKPLSIAHV